MILPIWILTFLLFNISSSYSDGNQIVVKYSGAENSLQGRISWALHESQTRQFRDGYWIVYSIQRLMAINATIGSYSSNLYSKRPSLSELITGITLPSDNYIEREMTTGEDDTLVMKDIGICIHYDHEGENTVENIVISNLSFHVDLDGDPLIWIGQAKDYESITFLKTLLPSCTTIDKRRDVVTAVGLHAPSKEGYDFLTDIIRNGKETALRENAVFWLGQQNTAVALDILRSTISTEPTAHIQEQAVFAIRQMTLERSIDTLIALARSANDGDVRSKAIFWLGQKASAKAEKILEEIAYTDDDTEVQRSALFALTQSDNNDAIPALIKIAKNHPNSKIRKDAIFWLGNSENPQALDALIEIVKK